MMGANLGAKKEWTNGRRGAGRDRETVISQGKVQEIFPIDSVKVPSHLLFDRYSSHHCYASRHQGQILGPRTIPTTNHQQDELTGLSALAFLHHRVCHCREHDG